jgi:ABC-type polysaccharide/polyol phosphate export permease
MSGITDGFRAAFLGRPFDVLSLAVSFAITILICIGGIAAFQGTEQRFADVL